MKKINSRCLALLVLIASVVALGPTAVPVAAQDPPRPGVISLESLLREMVDRDALARWPDPAYVGKQASSYDRNSIAPNPKDGAYKPWFGRDWGKGWFANHDFNNFLRTETRDNRRERVLLDHQGPGAIVRVWNALGGPAWNRGGTIRVYLDGATDPVIEMNNKDLVGGNGLVGEPFSYLASGDTTESMRRGRNLYFPIPYQSGCIVTWDDTDISEKADSLFYYHINYRAYAQGTKVETFTRQRLAELQPVVDQTAAALTAKTSTSAETQYSLLNTEIPAGQAIEVKAMRPAAINRLLIGISSPNLRQALRSVVLEITFDGQTTVWCPAGDFYGVGYSEENNRNLFIHTKSVRSGKIMVARWVMPFQDSVVVRLVNQGGETVTGAIAFDLADWQWDDGSMYFHAGWAGHFDIPSLPRRDINFVTVSGRGVYVGDSLTLYNGAPAWWGEGDEKIFVDGEAFPSHLGTGSEDYYGYAWGQPSYFSRPFHSQAGGAGNNKPGSTTNSRYRTLDAIPFTRSISMNMELWHWAKTNIDYCPTVFWYGAPGATGNLAPDPTGAARKVSD